MYFFLLPFVTLWSKARAARRISAAVREANFDAPQHLRLLMVLFEWGWKELVTGTTSRFRPSLAAGHSVKMDTINMNRVVEADPGPESWRTV